MGFAEIKSTIEAYQGAVQEKNDGLFYKRTTETNIPVRLDWNESLNMPTGKH